MTDIHTKKAQLHYGTETPTKQQRDQAKKDTYIEMYGGGSIPLFNHNGATLDELLGKW